MIYHLFIDFECTSKLLFLPLTFMFRCAIGVTICYVIAVLLWFVLQTRFTLNNLHNYITDISCSSRRGAVVPVRGRLQSSTTHSWWNQLIGSLSADVPFRLPDQLSRISYTILPPRRCSIFTRSSRLVHLKFPFLVLFRRVIIFYSVDLQTFRDRLV